MNVTVTLPSVIYCGGLPGKFTAGLSRGFTVGFYQGILTAARDVERARLLLRRENVKSNGFIFCLKILLSRTFKFTFKRLKTASS